MRAEAISPHDLSAAQLDEWRALAARAAEPNPFFEPDFVLPSLALPDADRVLLLVGSDGERWLGCLPVVPRTRWRRVPLRALASWTHLYCFLGSPLLDRDDPDAAAEALLEAAGSIGGGGFLGLDLLGADGPAASSIRTAAERRGRRVIVFEHFERAALRRGDDLALKRKRRHEIERLGRRLEEELRGQSETVDRAGDAKAVDEFLRLEGSGWKGREGTAFATIGHGDMFREVCERFAQAGRLRLLSREIGDRVVAMKCNLVAGDTEFTFKIAHDESLARFSPGIQLEMDNLELFRHNPDIELMDSCAVPKNQTFNRLWAGRRAIESAAVTLPGAMGAFSPLAIRATAALRDLRQRG